MSYNSQNPYDDQRPKQGGGNYQRKQYGGYNNNYRKGGNNFDRPKLTPDQLAALKLPVTVVVIGDDKLPNDVALKVGDVIRLFEQKGVQLRLSCVTNTDVAAREAASHFELHLPWKEFNGEQLKPNEGSYFNTEEALEYAKRFFYSDFEQAPKFLRANLGRNSRLLFGKSLKSPCQLLVVWTPGGEEITAKATNANSAATHAVRMACAAGIPVINLQNADAVGRVQSFLENINVSKQTSSKATGSTNTIYDDEDVPF